MEFLKTKEQILLKLADYSDPLENGLKNYSPSFFGLDVMYSCGSGKEFRLGDADEIYTFFSDDPRGELTGVKYSYPSGWDYLDITRIKSYKGKIFPYWHCYCFIRSPDQSDYCNLLKIEYKGMTFTYDFIKNYKKDSDDFSFTHCLWRVNENLKPLIKTVWSCKYKTACELYDGEWIEDDYNFMEKVRNQKLKQERLDAEYSVEMVKKYLDSIKNKDWDYVKYRTIIFTGSWLIAITIIVLIFVFVSWWY